MKDYYTALELNRSATSTEIKSAFRRLSRNFHPDVNGGSRDCEEKFKEINEAYHVLADARKRQSYDIMLAHLVANPRLWQTGQAAQPSPSPKPPAPRKAVYRRVYRPAPEDLRLEREYARGFWYVAALVGLCVSIGFFFFGQ
jgi:curved DNA-binding protein CbpA